ncbi:MAG: sigma-70 family RNA polymerase sigma factor [Oscillospiraceae bacterium]|nr:sigma-70 family RNA polymerase sigma factor [Oscillospiraceae bacterium]
MPETCIPDREDVIKSNIGLVHSCAHRFKGRGIEYEDLFQAGCMGLVKAADAFDYSRGLRFSTYAVPVILGEMRRLFRDGGTVKVSRTLKELSIKVNREREAYIRKHSREPTISEIAALMGLETAEVAEALSSSQPPLSLTSEDGDGATSQIDIAIESHEERVADSISLKEVISLLPPEDRKLITLRYFGGKTQSETAAMLGLTQVQVSRKEKKILSRLRLQLTG